MADDLIRQPEPQITYTDHDLLIRIYTTLEWMGKDITVFKSETNSNLTRLWQEKASVNSVSNLKLEFESKIESLETEFQREAKTIRAEFDKSDSILEKKVEVNSKRIITHDRWLYTASGVFMALQAILSIYVVFFKH